MTASSASTPPDEAARLRRRLERERASRLEAEAIAERGLRALYEREQEIRLLERIATAANLSHSVRDVLQFALTQICEFTRWPIGHAYLAHGEGADAVLRSTTIWQAETSERIAAFRAATEARDFASGEGLPGRVHAEGAPAWLLDVAEDANFPRLREAVQSGLRAACAFPVLVGSEVAAVLEFFTEEAIERDDKMLALMSQIGMQLGRVMERKRSEERLIHDASHDALTGLPNRALFLDRLNQAIVRRGAGRGGEFAVLFIDLDRFKVVNDSLGHLAGDELIVDVAARLREAIEPQSVPGPCEVEGAGGDTLARLGGDEFTILLSDIADPSDAVRVAERVQEALRRPFAIEGQDVYTSASIGIASSLSRYSSADDILRDADLAMYRAKALGKARCELFDQALHDSAMKRLALETDLRRALAQEEFVLHYQPIVSLDSQDVVGFEALVRWRRSDGALVYPSEFIEVTEDTGLIIFLGLWVLREACRTARAWQRDFPRAEPLTISVNISPRQFAQPDLVDQVAQIVAETGVEPTSLRLEITESVTIGDAERVIAVLEALKRIGVRLSIDDFGTGYSSLSYLHRFPLDILKIDRSFVSGMNTSAESLQIVQTIMSLARNLGMRVVAEGTEIAAQVAQLKSLGCDFGQGFYFSKPVDAGAATALLRGSGSWLRPEEPTWHEVQNARLAALAAKAS